MMRFTWTSISHADQAGSLSFVVLVNASVPSVRNPPKCNACIGPVRLVSGADVGHFGEFMRRFKRIGAKRVCERERSRRAARSLWRTKKRNGFGPGLGTEKGGVKTSPFSVPRAGVEPARVAPLVFETSASTDSAIWAWYQNRCEGTTKS